MTQLSLLGSIAAQVFLTSRLTRRQLIMVFSMRAGRWTKVCFAIVASLSCAQPRESPNTGDGAAGAGGSSAIGNGGGGGGTDRGGASGGSGMGGSAVGTGGGAAAGSGGESGTNGRGGASGTAGGGTTGGAGVGGTNGRGGASGAAGGRGGTTGGAGVGGTVGRGGTGGSAGTGGGGGAGNVGATGPLAPAQGALLGAFVGTGTVAQLEATLGRKLAVSHNFFGWNDDYTSWVRSTVAGGYIRLVTWEPWIGATGV